MPVSLSVTVTDADGLHEQLYKSTKDIVKIHAKGSDVGTTMYGNTNRSQSVCHRLVTVVCGSHGTATALDWASVTVTMS